VVSAFFVVVDLDGDHGYMSMLLTCSRDAYRRGTGRCADECYGALSVRCQRPLLTV
jgi:hypothetical protein